MCQTGQQGMLSFRFLKAMCELVFVVFWERMALTTVSRMSFFLSAQVHWVNSKGSVSGNKVAAQSPLGALPLALAEVRSKPTMECYDLTAQARLCR